MIMIRETILKDTRLNFPALENGISLFNGKLNSHSIGSSIET